MFGKRFSRALAVTTVASLVMATAAFANDKLTSDANLIAGGLQQSYTNSSLAAGATAVFSFNLYVEPVSGGTEPTYPIKVDIDAMPTWVAANTVFPITINGIGTANAVTVSFTATGQSVASSGSIEFKATNLVGEELGQNLIQTGAQSTFSVSVSPPVVTPPSNVAPTIEWTANPTSADEGDTQTYTFSITDAAADTHAFQAGYPDCGAGNTLVSSSIDDTLNTGTFDCLFPDGLVPATASGVKAKVQDNGGLGSNELTQNTTVSNVNPTVAADFGGPVDCQMISTLTIDPDDLGINDTPWKVNVSWGDGTTEPEISRSNLDSFNVTHVFALAGTYNATVSVADKDGGSGSDSTNSITVNQTYTLDFLPPFDDSTPSGLIVNKMKNGRVVPVKATIFDDCAFSAVTDPNANVTIRVSKTSGTVGTSDPVETYADAGESSAGTSSFRWSADGFWIYNLDSKALGLVTNNFYRVDVYVGTVKASVDNWAVLQPVK